MSADPKEQLLAEMDCFHCFYRFRQASSDESETSRFEAWLEYKAAIVRRDGLRCRTCGRLRPADELNVRTSRTIPPGSDEWEPENLVCVCVQCDAMPAGAIRPRRHGVLT